MKLFNSLSTFLRQHKKTLLLIVITSLTTVMTSSVASMWLNDFHNLTLPTIGTIKTVGVEAYWDPHCENRPETIDWDTMWPGTTKNVTLYIRNVSNVKTTLQLSASNIIPTDISEYLNLSWNYDGTPLNPNEVIQVKLFLSTSDGKSFSQYLIDNDVTNFNIDIYILASE